VKEVFVDLERINLTLYYSFAYSIIKKSNYELYLHDEFESRTTTKIIDISQAIRISDVLQNSKKYK